MLEQIPYLKNQIVPLLIQNIYPLFIICILGELFIWKFLDGRAKKMFSYIKPWFIYNLTILFFLFSLIYVFLNHVEASLFLTSLLFYSLVTSHIIKFKVLGLPIFFGDYKMISEVTPYIPKLVKKGRSILLGCLGLGLSTSVFVYLFSHFSSSVKIEERLVLLALTGILCLIFYFSFSISNTKFFPANSHRDCAVFKTGLLPFVLLSLKQMNKVAVPKAYNKETIIKIVEEFSKEESENNKEDINVIFYVIESFMDVHSLGLQIKNDPNPCFTSLNKNGSHKFVSPTFGGQTIQPEFELLTGLNQYQLNSANPLVYIIDKKSPFSSLPLTLQKQGFKTNWIVAEPPNAFQRNIAAPLLGFDHFVGLRTNNPDIPQIHGEVQDAYLVDTLLKALPEKGSSFSYVMTNSSHASYHDWPQLQEFEILNSGLSQASKRILAQYFSAINYADKALQKLVSRLEKEKRKTILYTYGDHLPGIRSVFDELNLFKNEQYVQQFQTPMRMWANFDLSNDEQIISPNLIPSLLQKQINRDLKLPLQYRIAEKLNDQYRVISNHLETHAGEIIQRSTYKNYQDSLLEQYDLIQYDLLFGKQFSLI